MNKPHFLLTRINQLNGYGSPVGIGSAAINYPDEFEELYKQMQAIVEKRRQVNSGQLEMFPAVKQPLYGIKKVL